MIATPCIENGDFAMFTCRSDKGIQLYLQFELGIMLYKSIDNCPHAVRCCMKPYGYNHYIFPAISTIQTSHQLI